MEKTWIDFEKRCSQTEVQIGNPREFRLQLRHAPPNLHGQPAATFCLEWGRADQPLLIMAGGLVNTAYRFGFLATALSEHFHCVALDWYGRGNSDWFSCQADYSFEANVQQIVDLLAWSGDRPVYFLGSSLGGLAAMAAFADQPHLLKALILNDVGPHMAASRRERRANALSKHRVFSSGFELQQKVGVAEKNSGAIPQDILDFMAWKNTCWEEPGKTRVYRYDLACMRQYALEAQRDVNLWDQWMKLDCPQLLLHGELSDALDIHQVSQMQQAVGDRLKVLSIAGAGHTPSLCTHFQINQIREWLLKQASRSTLTVPHAVGESFHHPELQLG